VVKLGNPNASWTFPEVAMDRFLKVVLLVGLFWGLVGCSGAAESTPFSINGTPLPKPFTDDFSIRKWLGDLVDANGSLWPIK
jgi:hypothetical protein